MRDWLYFIENDFEVKTEEERDVLRSINILEVNELLDYSWVRAYEVTFSIKGETFKAKAKSDLSFITDNKQKLKELAGEKGFYQFIYAIFRYFLF